MRLSGKTKLRSLDRHLRGIDKGTPVVVALTELDRHRAALRRAGFSDVLEEGETVLPTAIGKVSAFNAEGGHIIHRDRSKETVYRQQEWTWEEWHGPYDRVEQSRIVDVPYERYPRTRIPPPAVELSVANDVTGDKVVVTGPLDYTDANNDALLHRINLLRELFGEAEMLTENLKPFTRIKVRRVNWEILPEGEMPWARLRERLEPIMRQFGERKGPAVEHRLRLLIEDHEPDFTAVGRAGFHGYLVFGYKHKSVYVLESLHYGNATYLFDEGWERLSQMTKAEILAEDLHKARVIHREGWEREMRKLLR